MKNLKIYLIFLFLLPVSIYSQTMQSWTAREDYGKNDAANAVTADDAGNVYICGSKAISSSVSNIVTIKYSSAGLKLWEATYNDLSDQDERAVAIAVDAFGFVYVLGRNNIQVDDPPWGMILLKYDRYGNLLWAVNDILITDFHYGTCMALDYSGNIYVGEKYGSLVSGTGALVKYNSSGVMQWKVNTGSVYAIALDNDYHPVITGTVTGFKYFTAMYLSNGVQQWMNTSAGACNVCDAPDAITIDPQDNVYQTGPVDNSIVTNKYNSAGMLLWTKSYSNGNQNRSSAIGHDAEGNVYVGGNSSAGSDVQNYIVIKYDNAGTQQWTSIFSRSGAFDQMVAMVVDGLGNTYTTGYSQTGFNNFGSADYSTVKFDPRGVMLWQMTYNGPVDSTDVPTSIFRNNTGVYVTGYSIGANHTYDFLTIKYLDNPTGIHNPTANIPDVYSLEQNYPNPFNPSTIIRYGIPANQEDVTTKLVIFNSLGQEVTTLVNSKLSPGVYEAVWDARNSASGIYYYKLTSGSFVDTKKMVLVK